MTELQGQQYLQQEGYDNWDKTELEMEQEALEIIGSIPLEPISPTHLPIYLALCVSGQFPEELSVKESLTPPPNGSEAVHLNTNQIAEVFFGREDKKRVLFYFLRKNK